MTASFSDSHSLLTVSRGLQVLRAFRSDRNALSNAELVRRTGLPKATISRLTSTLIEMGFLRNPPGSRHFELATGALSIGHAFVASSEIVQVAGGFMQELADELNVSVALAVPNQLDMLYIGYRASQRVATLRLGVGSVLPMGSTAIGHAWLWCQPEAQRAQLLNDMAQAHPQAWDEVRQSIQRSFIDLDATGVCGLMSMYQRDVFAFALPIRVGRDRTVMGLSCGKAEIRPNFVAERKRIGPVLKRAAMQLEGRLASFSSSP